MVITGRVAAVAWIQFLAGERVYVTGAAKKWKKEEPRITKAAVEILRKKVSQGF